MEPRALWATLPTDSSAIQDAPSENLTLDEHLDTPVHFNGSSHGTAVSRPALRTDSLASSSELVEREMMAAEEKSQHYQRGHEIPAEDSPRLERVEQPRPQDQHGGEDGHLEAAEEHEDTEQQMSLTLRQCEEACDRQPEDDES